MTNVAPGDTVTYTAGNNIEVKQVGKEIQIATSMTPTFTTVNTTNLNTTGVTNLGGTTNITGDAYYTGPITNDTHIVNKEYVDNSVTTLANNPLTFAGDTGTDVARKLGETLNIVGGNTGTLTDGNIGIEGNGTDTLTVKLASDLTDLNSVSITNGPTINSSGIDMGDTKITNLAPGTDGTDAVNLNQLTEVSNVANKGWNVATDSGATAVSNVKPGDTATFNGDGENIAVTNDGNTVTVALTKDINVDSITLNGKNGADGISITGAVGAPGVNGTDGITRIIYTDPTTGEPTEVATLNDGLKFAGNTGDVIAKKLNETLSIEGELAEGEDATGANLRVDSADGKLNLVMAKDLTDLNSIVINGGPTINSSGIDMGDTKITNLAPGTDGTDAVNLNQLTEVSNVANKGWTVATDSGTAEASNVKPGDTATFNGDGENIAVTNDGNTVTVALTKDINVDSITLNGKNGADGISITGAVGAPGVNGTDGITRIIYTDPTTGEPTEVATLNDGLKFAGNTGDVIAKKLNETLSIEGELAEGEDATGANLRVDSADGKLNLVMAQDLTDLNSITINGGPVINNAGINMNGGTITNLAAGVADTDAVNVSQLKEVSNVANAGWNIATDSGTASNVKPGDTVNMKGDGSVVVSNTGNDVTVGLADVVTVGQGDTAVTIDGTKGTIQAGTEVTIDGNTGVIQAGDVTINGDKGTVNGLSNITWDANNIVSGQAATEDQLKAVADNVTTAVGAAKTEVEAGKNVTVSSQLGDKGQTIYTVATKDEVDFNKVTVGGLTIDKGNVDVAGNTIISGVGAGEISSTSTDAVNGSQLYATNQQVDQNTTNIAKNTTDITNINTTLDKGLNFSADSGTAVNRKLGDTVAITGDSNITTTTTANGVQVKLSDSIDVKNVNVSQNFTVAEGANVNMGGNVIQNVAPGVNGTDAVNVNQLNNVASNFASDMRKAYGGVAAAMALESAPYIPGTTTFAVGTGYFQHESAFGVSLRRTADNGRWSLTGGATVSRGGVGARIAVTGILYDER